MKKSIIIFIYLLSCFTCVYAQKINRNLFADVLNVKVDIADTKDIEKSFFSDMGAWHAYALPKEKEGYGSFIGPLVMDLDGQWLANTISKIVITEKDRKSVV